MIKQTLIFFAASSLLAGCAGTLKAIPEPEDSPVTAEKAKTRVAQTWTEPAIVREGKPMVVLYTPFEVPASVAATPIDAGFEPGATVKDLAAALGNQGVSIIIADKEAADASFYLPKFKGSLGKLMSAIGQAADVWFTYHDGVIVVSSKERIGLTLPQDEALAKKVGEGLAAIGATGSVNSAEAGLVFLELKHSQFRRAKSFLGRITQNSALVTLQIALVTVQLNQNDQQGIDWSKMSLALGRNGQAIFDPNGGAAQNLNSQNGSNSVGTTSTGTATSTTGTTTTTATTGTSSATVVATTSLPAYLNTLTLTGNGARLALSNGLFSLASFVNFLGSYGNTETLQNVMLKTTTGNKVELKSVTSIPYVSSVGIATTGTTGANNSVGLLGSAKTSSADDGLTLKLTPSFDSAANTVTLNLDMSIQSVLAFNTLQAGSQIGSFSQPTTATRSFNDILRLRPGETVVVGGISYETVDKETTSPLFLRDSRYESKALTIKKTTMFIVIRPTVRTFGALEAQEHDAAEDEGATPGRRAREHGEAQRGSPVMALEEHT